MRNSRINFICLYLIVINTSCPRAFAEEIWWKKAAFGTTAKEKCPSDHRVCVLINLTFFENFAISPSMPTIFNLLMKCCIRR